MINQKLPIEGFVDRTITHVIQQLAVGNLKNINIKVSYKYFVSKEGLFFHRENGENVLHRIKKYMFNIPIEKDFVDNLFKDTYILLNENRHDNEIFNNIEKYLAKKVENAVLQLAQMFDAETCTLLVNSDCFLESTILNKTHPISSPHILCNVEASGVKLSHKGLNIN